jgi:xanthine dehydrogenase large subunit
MGLVAQARANFTQLETDVAAFNASSRYVKQGLALSPIRFAVQDASGFTAVVSVRSDATVLVQQSGCELGQGLYEKQAQCAAYSLNCPYANVSVDNVRKPKSTCDFFPFVCIFFVPRI